MRPPKDAFYINCRRKDRFINVTQLFDQWNDRNGTHLTIADYFKDAKTKDFLSRYIENQRGKINIATQGRNIWVPSLLFRNLMAWFENPYMYVVVKLQKLENLPIRRLGGDAFWYNLTLLFPFVKKRS